jgi:hypothetical protein
MSVYRVSSSKSSDSIFPKVRPTLDLNFANSKTLDPRITFTRSSGGSYVGADGLIKYAGVNEPRFDHDPVTGESLGLLIEEQRTNLLTYSEAHLGNWSLSNLTISEETIAGPAGTIPYSKITLGVFGPPSSTTDYGSTASVRRTTTILSSGSLWTASAYVKAGTARYVYFAKQYLNSSSDGLYFDLQTGRISTGSSFPVSNGKIQNVGNGWYRISIYGTEVGPGGSNSVQIVPMTTFTPLLAANGLRLYTGNRETMYLYGVQYEAGFFPTSYIPTTTAAVTRAADVAQITGTNFSSWYNQSQGTVFTSTKLLSSAADDKDYGAYFAAGSDTATRIRHDYAGAGGVLTGLNIYSDAASLVGNATLTFSSTVRRTASAVQAGNIAFSANGAIATSTSTLMPSTVDRLFLTGRLGSGLNKTIARLTFWPKRLPNAQLQALTR